MYRFELSIDIAAPAERVWRALCDPDEVARWDSGVVQALDAPPDYPRPGQHVRWRTRGRLWRVLHDRPQEVVQDQRLRSLLDLGPSRLGETYTLRETRDGCRLDLDVALRVGLAVVGQLVERVLAGPAWRRGFESALATLKRYCEGNVTPRDESRGSGS